MNADVPAAPAANRNGKSGRQQLEAATTLARAPKLATTVPFEPGLFFCSVISVCCMLLTVGPIHVFKFVDQWTTLVVFDLALMAQLALTVPQSAAEFFLQMGEAPDFGSNILQLPVQHRLHFWAQVLFLAKRQQFLNFSEREAQFLSVPDKCEVTNLITAKQAIPASASGDGRNESQLLVETDRVHAHTGLLRRLSNVHCFRHHINRINPGVKSRVKGIRHQCGTGKCSPSGLCIQKPQNRFSNTIT